MDQRPLGASNLNLSLVGLGTWAIGGPGWPYGWGPQDDQTSRDAIHRALDLGVNWVDTAAVYGLGHAETIVGQALKGRDHIILATKCGLVWDDHKNISGRLKAQSIRDECHASLKRLQRDRIDLYQIHWPDPKTDIEEAWETFVELKKEGKIRELGVSNFSCQQMERVCRIHPITSLQPPYNMLRPEIEQDIIPYCKKTTVGIVAYSPMHCGLLTGRMTQDRIAHLPDEDWRKLKSPSFQEPELSENLKLVDHLKPIAQKEGMTLAQLAVAWTLRNNTITSAIVGIRSPQQIEDILSINTWTLSQPSQERITKLLDTRMAALRSRKE